MKFLVKDSFKKRALPAWIWVSLTALTIRIPLLFLPNPGRDEAAYFYWSHHFEPAYSLLMQVIVRFFTFLPLPSLFAMRLPSVLMGILVIFLLDKLLQLRGVDYKFRLLVLVLFAFSPWQSNFGVMLNPDNFLLAAILLFLISIIKGRYFLAAFFAGLAVLSKPTGVLILPAVWFVFLVNKNLSIARKCLCVTTSLVLLTPVIVSMKTEMLIALLEFGKMDPSVSSPEALLLQLLLLILGGGPLLLFYAGAGLKQRLKKHTQPENLNTENKATFAISIFIFLFYGAAFIFNSQVKYNWLLPAVVILWPNNFIPLRKAILVPGIILSIGLGVFQNVAKTKPKIMVSIENAIPELKSTFTLKGGIREARVSASNSWSEHLFEYHSMRDFVQQIKMTLHQSGKDLPPIRWIICDDYGLASQLVFAFGSKDLQMIIPNDGIFHRTMPKPPRKKLDRSVLIIAVHREIQSVWEGIAHIRETHLIQHPVTDKEITIGISNGDLLTSKQ